MDVWIVHKSDVIYGVFKDCKEALKCRKKSEHERELQGYWGLGAFVSVTKKVLN